MGWIALSQADSALWSPAGLAAAPDAAPLVPKRADVVMARGSLMFEIGPSNATRPSTVLSLSGTGVPGVNVQVLPGAAVSFAVECGGMVLYHLFPAADVPKTAAMRLSFSWDHDAGWAFLALERSGQRAVETAFFKNPPPLRMVEIKTLMQAAADPQTAPGLVFLALSSRIEPVGPRPSLAPSTRIGTPHGSCAIGMLQKGDLVRTADGEVLPVLHALTQDMPAAGSLSPLRVTAPRFGLERDLVLAGDQGLVLDSPDVAYHLGQNRAVIPASFMTTARPARQGPLVRYCQLVLPVHTVLVAEGAPVASLNIGRLRRSPERLSLSLLAGEDRDTLPEHAALGYAVQRRYEAALFSAA